MKKIILSLTMIAFATGIIHAQNTFPATGSAGIGTTAPNVSSLLEIKSTTKGLLIPRMTTKQKNLIASPALGLLVYQTDSTTGFYYYNGTSWKAIAGTAVTETDPQVGTITTGKIPRWDGSALSTGAIYDNGNYTGVAVTPDSKYRFNSRTTQSGEFEVLGKSAIRGESNGYSGLTNNIHATGYLGVKQPSAIYSVLIGFSNSELGHLGVFGVKEFDTTQGAGVYGWTRGGAEYNYGTMGVSTSNSGNNYGTYGKAIGNGGLNTGVFGKAEDGPANFGVFGTANTTTGQFGYGVYGSASGTGTNHAGYFVGHVNISNDGEALTVTGTEPLLMMKNGSSNIGYLKASDGNFTIGASSPANMTFRMGGTDKMVINSGGRFLLNGSTVSTGIVNIKGSNELLNLNGTDPLLQFTSGATKIGYLRTDGVNVKLSVNSTNTNGNLQFLTQNKTRLWILPDGKISISDDGKVANGYLLNIKGKAIAEEVLVELNGSWPDYVFAKDYKLMSFSQLREYVSTNNHLPQIPAAAEMKDGIALGNMNKLLTEKVEELTLYILQLHDEIEQLKKKVQ